MTDKATIIQIIGSLMKYPNYLSETDKYDLSPQDFNTKLNKYIFISIENLYRNGAKRIQPIDIENYLSSNVSASQIFQSQNGIEFLQDAIYLSDEGNFPYYYKKLKKFNLLEKLKHDGISIDNFYCENPISEQGLKINEKFEQLDIEDIINHVKKTVSLIEGNFVNSNEVMTWDITQSIDKLIEGFGDSDSVGLPINGHCINRIINGAQIGALTIRSAGTGVGKTRLAVGDACKLAYPFTYNWNSGEWENTGFDEKVLFICTEQEPREIEKMILGYITGINESKFKYAMFTKEETKVIQQAVNIIKTHNNMFLMRMPSPTVDLIKVTVRNQVILHDIKYCFFDYIFASGSLYKEFKGNNLRTDEALLLLSTALKDIAQEQRISVFTATQLNAKGDDNKDIRNESALSGSRAIANKCDNGIIVARPTKEEIDFFTQEKMPIPNRVSDVYKARGSEWTYVRIWSEFDLGTCRLKDLFVTDARLQPIEDFYDNSFSYEWEVDESIIKEMAELNQ